MKNTISNDKKVFNINVGVLGHVDSGKTSLVKALSTSLSTAALDKHPQSQQRGITLDLGFSSFVIEMSERLKEEFTSSNHLNNNNNNHYDALQFTLVDCPGHSSLIRTIIGGAQIIDMIVLVIDINKGIQAQTIECIAIGEMTSNSMIIVLNKVDKIPIEDREIKIQEMKKEMRHTFNKTKFSNAPIVVVAAAIGGEKVAAINDPNSKESGDNYKTNNNSSNGNSSNNKKGQIVKRVDCSGIDSLLDTIQAHIKIPKRNTEGNFYFAIDHCFAIKGHGTIITGTILKGSVQQGSMIEIPEQGISRKVKSMQMFRKPVTKAKQGDRVGICLSNFDAKSTERGIAATPGSVPLISRAICLIRKIKYFNGSCKTGSIFHVSIGHTTVTAEVTFFGYNELSANNYDDNIVSEAVAKTKTDVVKDTTSSSASLTDPFENDFPISAYDWEQDMEYQAELMGGNSQESTQPLQWAYVVFKQPIFCPKDSLIIGSRLNESTYSESSRNHKQGKSQTSSALSTWDSETNHEHCRLAFYGPIRESLSPGSDQLPPPIFNWKTKEAKIFKIAEERNGLCYEIIGWKLYQKQGSVRPFIGMKLETMNGHYGTIIGPFGSTDKFRVRFEKGVKGLTLGQPLTLRFKRFLHDRMKGMHQRGIDFTDDNSHDQSENVFNITSDTTTITTTTTTTTTDDDYDASKVDAEGTSFRCGTIEKVKEGTGPDLVMTIVVGVFTQEENIKEYIESKVSLADDPDCIGRLVGPFAKMGKCKVEFPSSFLNKLKEGSIIKVFVR